MRLVKRLDECTLESVVESPREDLCFISLELSTVSFISDRFLAFDTVWSGGGRRARSDSVSR